MKPGLLLIGGATERMLERMRAEFDVHPLDEIDDVDGFLAERGDRIVAVATNGHDGVETRIMTALPNLGIVACYGVGYDAIDAAEAARRGIVVTHTPDVLNAEVANTAIMLMLALSRCLLRDDAWVRSGRWEAEGNAPLSHSVENRRIGLLGMGRIGQEIAHRLEIFSPEIHYHARSEKPDLPYRYHADPAAMAEAVEVLICITPGGADTRHIVGRPVLEALGPEGMLINVSRGSVVDEAELIAALQDGRLGWAGLDVFEHEPRVPEALKELRNVVLLPHVGSATVETRRAMGDLVTDNLSRYLKDGTTLTPVPECADL